MTPLFPNVFVPATFVLDVSVSAGWLLGSRASPYTSATLTRLGRTAAAVPAGFPADIAQAWLDGEAAGEVGAALVALRLSQLRNFSIHLDDGREPHIWTATVPLARRVGLPVARAAYLELAVRLGLPLVTTDPALVAAAPAAGVGLLAP